MALVLADRVRDTTTTTGTGTVTLSGTAPTGYQTFGTAIGNGNTTYYTINAGSQWEVGIGTYTAAGTTLSRGTVLASSNAGALVNFSAGTKDVFVTYPAEKSVNQDASGNVGIGTSAPASAFEISRTSTSSIGYSTSTTSTYLSRWTARNTDVSLDLYCSLSALTTGVGDVGTTSNHPLTFTTNNSERMRLDTSGNFAVGTTSANSFRTYVKQSSANQAGLAVAASAATTETRIFNDGTLAGVASSYSGTASFLPLTFWTSDAEQMRVTTGGNLALGTTTAASTSGRNITIGGIEPSLVLNASGARSFSIASGGNYQYTGSTLSFIDNTAGATRMLIDSSGNLGVGTSSPTAISGYTSVSINNGTNGAILDLMQAGVMRGRLVATTSALGMETSGTIPLAFFPGGVEKMRLTTAGRLGIGVTAPADALDVKSAIYVTSPSSVSMPAVRASNFGYSTGYSAVVFGATSGNVTPCINVDPIANTSGSFPGNGNEVMFRNGVAFETPNAANNSYHTNIIVMKDGLVGVGTSSPATTLDVNGSSSGNVVAVSASAVDCATGNYFTKTASGALTWTFTNVPASRAFIFALQLTNGGSGTQTWPAAVVWDGGTAPTLQASGTDILVFTTSNSGTTWRGVRSWKQA